MNIEIGSEWFDLDFELVVTKFTKMPNGERTVCYKFTNYTGGGNLFEKDFLNKFEPRIKLQGKDMQQSTLDTHFKNFTQWSTDRKIIQNGNVLAQGLKLVSEVGELADNLAKGRCIKDDIGDCCVVLNNLVHMQGLTLDECLEQAWTDIKDRTGEMNQHGVFIKSEDVEK